MAEGDGFEPPVRFPVQRFSSFPVGDDASGSVGGIRSGHGHQPLGENGTYRADKNPREHVGDVVVATINCGHAHRDEEREEHPEQVAAVAPRFGLEVGGCAIRVCY
jgi:hypothetical protein